MLPMVIPPTIGVVLVLVGLALFFIDLSVTNHGLLTAAAILTLIAGGLVVLRSSAPYSGMLLAILVVVAIAMGVMLFGVLVSLRASRRKVPLTGKEGIIGEVGTVKSPIGAESAGWVFVHGERWQAVGLTVPRESGPQDHEPLMQVGTKVVVAGFIDGRVMEVVPVEWSPQRQDLDSVG